jgi:glycosyltransferase involved in cell wall biosynthesis
MFPRAHFYTSYFDQNTASWAKKLTIHSSFIQNLPNVLKKNRVLSIPLYPFAFESINFSSYDVVISVTSSFAKAVITKPSTLHLCYLLTPTRFLWTHVNEYLESDFQKALVSPFKHYLKKWDFVASQRPDVVIALSESIRKRCKKFYKRNSQVIYPPFDAEYWTQIKSEILNPKSEANSNFKILNDKYYLLVSRLEPYKRVDLAIKVFNELPDITLIVVGTGSLEKSLKNIANRNIRFISYVSDEELAGLYASAEALIMPQEEDFGYVSLEAQFFGCPVVAFGKGGATETVLSDKTGVFFSLQTVSSLKKALEQFHTMSYNLKVGTQKIGVNHVQKFDKSIFKNSFLETIHQSLKL